MVNMSAKFDKEIYNGLLAIVFTRLFLCLSIVTLTFDLQPPKSIGSIYTAKFDKEIHYGLVSIVFRSLFQDMSIVTLTFDLQNQ